MLRIGLLSRMLIIGVVCVLAYMALRVVPESSLGWRSSFECRDRTCRELSGTELRERVIKSYLHARLDQNVSRRYAGGSDRLVLLKMSVDPLQLIREVESGTLLSSMQIGSSLISTHAQIDAMNIEDFGSYGSIASYSLNHREVEFAPLDGFRQADVDEVARYEYLHKQSPLVTDEAERVRGYGRKFYWIQEFDRISLACCDGLGDKAGLSERWLKDNSIVNISKSRPRVFLISEGGAILVRPGSIDIR